MRRALAILVAVLAIAVAPLRAVQSDRSDHATVSALDAAIQTPDLPAPLVLAPRVPLAGGGHAFEREVPSSTRRRGALALDVTAGSRRLLSRSRPRRHVPRMASSDPDPG